MNFAPTFPTKHQVRTGSQARSLRLVLRAFLILSLIILIALGAWTYTTRLPSVVGSHVSRGAVADVVYATGFVEPQSPVDVASRISAPVRSVLVEEGDRVARGQALATLDAEDQRESIAQLSAERIKAEQDKERALALFRDGWVAKAARDQAVQSAAAARAAEAAARAKLDQYVIRSGISGVVLRRDVEPGELATPTKLMFAIGDPRRLRVTAIVDERDIPLVRTGLKVMMSSEAYRGRVFRGRVYEITPGGDPDQRAFRVRISPDDGANLPVGLTLEVNILVSQRQQAMLVPASAVRDNTVWVATDGTVRKTPVAVGIQAADRIEVRSGIRDRACVLRNPPVGLKDGQRVSLKGC